MLKRISDEEIDKLWDKYEREDPIQVIPFDIIIAQAQLEADIKATRHFLVRIIAWVNKHTYINAKTGNPFIELNEKDEAEWQKLCSIALNVDNDEDKVAEAILELIKATGNMVEITPDMAFLIRSLLMTNESIIKDRESAKTLWRAIKPIFKKSGEYNKLKPR